MRQVFEFIKKNLSKLIILSVFGGLFIGYNLQVSFMKSWINIILFVMIYPMMINMDILDVFKGLSNYKPILLSLGLNFLISPLIAFVIGKLFFADYPMLMVGLLLIALIPTSGMTASWTGLAKGNLKLALILMSVNLLVSIPMIPIYMNLFMGEALDINTAVIFISLLRVVLLPLILGDLTRRLILVVKDEAFFKSIKPLFSGISSSGVLVIVFVAIALKSRTILSQLDLVFYAMIPLTIYYLMMMLISHFSGRRILDREDQIALVYGVTLRNLTIALGLSIGAFGESLAVFLIAIAYVLQLPLASTYRNYVQNRKLQYQE